eukprot:CAMPEP_0172487182 /NCGR_PEP_ID=MMETSP1066-20121228/16139_1 /TAXON_ID=671091 /ORGANISM="Coscinodiscus wailesii, Strain CCMP2513" /LENGTH=149 /DNA_ID=CAMNT_0013253629 /DNA_START=283 /DNA_END=732 /DNA_ORIENTATION=+
MYFGACIVIFMSALQMIEGQGEDKRANLMNHKELMKDVAGGEACYTIEEYSTGSGCSGSPVFSGAWTVPDSVESGCIPYGSAGSYMRSYLSYCDSEGYNQVYFSSLDCSGDGIGAQSFPNGCFEEDGRAYKQYCSLDGPCSTDVKESLA